MDIKQVSKERLPRAQGGTLKRARLQAYLLSHKMMNRSGKAFCENALERGPPYPGKGQNWLRANMYVAAARLCFIEEIKKEFDLDL